MLQIDQDVPLPDRRVGPGKPPTYPFAKMRVGDSFLAPLAKAERVLWAAKAWRGRHEGFGYTARKTAEGLRVWRTS